MHAYARKFFEHYKINIVLSSLLIIAILSFLSYTYLTNGDIIERGVDFKGGYQYVISYNLTEDSLSSFIEDLKSRYPGVSIRKIEEKNIMYVEYTEEIQFEHDGVEVQSKRVVQSSLAEEFWRNALRLIIISYFLVTLVVFFIFRSFVPSIAIILAGVSDILFAISVMNILDIPLTMATLSALLILVGYSIDTDILLTTRILKEKPSDVISALVHSLKTGLTMTFTSIVAMIALIIFSPSITLDRIATVILAGLVADIIFTWFQNASILQIYMNRKYRK